MWHRNLCIALLELRSSYSSIYANFFYYENCTVVNVVNETVETKQTVPGEFQRLFAIRSRLSRCSTKRASFNGDVKHMANLLKHSRSLHLEILYRIHFFFIYTINIERQREREKAQFSKRKKMKEENGSSASCVRDKLESSFSFFLSFSHTISQYIF